MIDYSCLCSWTKEKITCCFGTVTICWNKASAFNFIFLHLYPLCTVCRVQQRLASSCPKSTSLIILNSTAIHIKNTNGVVSLWLSVGIFFFANFDAVGGNVLPANTSHVLSGTQRCAPNNRSTASFVLNISAKKPFTFSFFFGENYSGQCYNEIRASFLAP